MYMPGHRDCDRRARDDHRAARRAGRALERLVRGQAAAPLLARANDVEERVVDADGHADQHDHGLRRVVEREHLADRSEQAERGGDSCQREQHRNERRDDGAEREQKHEQRDRDREELGALQVAVDRRDRALRSPRCRRSPRSSPADAPCSRRVPRPAARRSRIGHCPISTMTSAEWRSVEVRTWMSPSPRSSGAPDVVGPPPRSTARPSRSASLWR